MRLAVSLITSLVIGSLTMKLLHKLKPERVEPHSDSVFNNTVYQLLLLDEGQYFCVQVIVWVTDIIAFLRILVVHLK